jgi:hypothetical protein
VNAIPQSFHLLERISRPAPFGIIFWDFVTGTAVRDGLLVSVAPADRPESSCPLFVNRNSVWLTAKLPGFSTLDFLASDWEALQRTYRITVFDTLGRFLPLQLDAELPSRGLFDWPGWAALPKTPLAPLGKSLPPARISPDRIPLFSASGRTAPEGRAEVRAELLDLDTGVRASWALLTAKYKNVVRGIGLADRDGRTVLFFSYPERPAPTLANPPAIADYQWELTLQAYYQAPAGPAPEIADLALVMAQLQHPRDLLAKTVAPTETLPNPQLTLGQALVVRTSETEEGPSSSLFLAPE